MSIILDQDGPVWTVTIDRPEARNAVDPETATRLYRHFLEFEQTESARVAVLTGAGGAFCAGFDLKRAAELDLADWAERLAIPPNWEDQAEAPRPAPMGPTRLALSKPVIAAIAGPAVAGGMELALWCDLRVMEETAYLGVFCRRWGVPLVDGGTIRLPRLIGASRAMDLILTGRKVEAAEALAIGLANRVVAPGTGMSAAQALAAEIARFPQACMRADRASARRQWTLEESAALRAEWRSIATFAAEGQGGAARFAAGKGRGGDFGEI
jgi:enoyl-CoA hydratase